MKIFTFFFLLVTLVSSASSQRIDRSVIASNGGIDKASNISLEWTLGESIAASSYTSTRLYTQGFNQPTLKIKYKTFIDPYRVTFKLTVAPNPVQSMLHVYWWSDNETSISFRLTDVHGRILENKNINLKSGNTQFNMGNLAGGMYFLQVRNSKGTLINTYQVVKAQ